MRAGSTLRPKSNTSSPSGRTRSYQRIILIVRLNPAILGNGRRCMTISPEPEHGVPESEPGAPMAWLTVR
jgi:hypothetical protein